MCKDMFNAIHAVAKTVESDIVVLMMNHAKIKGKLACMGGEKCNEGVITLQDAEAHCKQTGHKCKFKWLNVSSYEIQAFTFNCCIEEDCQ